MHLRRRNCWTQKKLFIPLFLLIAFYCEWFVYVIQPLFWSELKCQDDCTKILFIADPQIQGELWAPFPFNFLFIYDSDQYSKRTFSVVTSHFKPDVLVYLGDIMDEGSIATEEQYQRYVKRIKNIFVNNYNPEVDVWVPGDNDIGGENERIKRDKIEAFEREFQHPNVVTWRNISYYKVNAIINYYPKLEHNTTDLYKIVVSHYPVTSYYTLKSQVLQEIHPNVMFCAHSHDSKYVINFKNNSSRETYQFLPGKEVEPPTKCDVHVNPCPAQGVLQVLPSDEVLYEIYVPTCSYRMGTNKIGYGAAVFDHKSRTLTYTVFWSPQRFLYLFFYLALLVIAIIIMLVVCTTRWHNRRYGLYKSLVAGQASVSKTY